MTNFEWEAVPNDGAHVRECSLALGLSTADWDPEETGVSRRHEVAGWSVELYERRKVGRG